MSVAISTIGMLYGIVADKPTLPGDGWKYIESAEDWLIAKSPIGATYYVSKTQLFRQKISGTGRYYVDTRETIAL